MQYKIKIVTTNINTNRMFTGSFTHQNKILALESVTVLLQLSYRINGANVEFYKDDLDKQ